jgi:hypothetical protein
MEPEQGVQTHGNELWAPTVLDLTGALIPPLSQRAPVKLRAKPRSFFLELANWTHLDKIIAEAVSAPRSRADSAQFVAPCGCD